MLIELGLPDPHFGAKLHCKFSIEIYSNVVILRCFREVTPTYLDEVVYDDRKNLIRATSMVLKGFPIFRSVPGDVSRAVCRVEIRYPPSGIYPRNRLHMETAAGSLTCYKFVTQFVTQFVTTP